MTKELRETAQYISFVAVGLALVTALAVFSYT